MFGIGGKWKILTVSALAVAAAFVLACQGETRTIEVIKEVPVEKIVTQEVVKEVPVEKIVTKEIIKEVPKEVVRTVEVEKQVEVIKEVVRTVEVEKQVEVTKREIVQIVVTPTPEIMLKAEPVNAPDPKGDAGIITVAISDVPPGVGLGSTQLADEFHYWGVGEVTMKTAAGGVVEPMLATSWELKFDDDGRPSGATLMIRDDVIFHGEGLGDRSNAGAGWGPMTAEDVAFTINDGNTNLNPNSIHWQAGDLASMFGNNEAIAVDSTTLDLTFTTDENGNPQFDPRWSANLLNDAGQAFSVQSLARFNAVGKQEMQDAEFIGTGPLHIVSWLQDDTGILEAVPYSHWRLDSKVDRIIFKEVAEENTQIALMETGEIDAAPITIKNVPRMLEGGFQIQDNGLANLKTVVFAGNLWETNHILFDTPLDTAAVYMRDVPWVGNPNDPADLAEAKLVRNALARAVDRDLMNEVLMNGIGFPNYLNQFSSQNPNWQDKWNYPYDPDEAERLLDEAGHAKKSNGKRFEIPLFTPSPGVDGEIGDVVAGFWEKIGVSTAVQKYSYSVFRPTIVARATTLPWITQCDDGKSTWPWDWPKSQDHTSYTRGGFGCGLEIKVVADTWKAVAAETDINKRIELNNNLAQYLFEEAVSFGLIGMTGPITYNPNKIAEWPMEPGLFATTNNHEAIVPVGR